MALPDVVTRQDRLLTVDTSKGRFLEGLPHPGSKAYPLFLAPQNGVWVLRVKFAPGVTLPLHFHTGTVHIYTMSGPCSTRTVRSSASWTPGSSRRGWTRGSRTRVVPR